MAGTFVKILYKDKSSSSQQLKSYLNENVFTTTTTATTTVKKRFVPPEIKFDIMVPSKKQGKKSLCGSRADDDVCLL